MALFVGSPMLDNHFELVTVGRGLAVLVAGLSPSSPKRCLYLVLSV
jgi:hypothetical protein